MKEYEKWVVYQAGLFCKHKRKEIATNIYSDLDCQQFITVHY